MFKKFISYYKPHKTLFILDMACAVGAAVLAILFPILTRTLLADYIPASRGDKILWSLLFMLFIYLLKMVLTYIRMKWGHFLGVRMEADMRRDLFNHIQKLSFSYFDRVKTGHLMSRISNDLNMISEVAHHGPEDFLISIVVLILGYGGMFIFNSTLALICLIPLPFMILWGVFMGTRLKKGFRGVRKQIAVINSTVENSVQGIREVKSFANEGLEEEKFASSNGTFRKAKENVYNQMARFHSIMQLLRELYYFCVIAGGSYLIYKGSLTIVDLLAFTLYISVILPPIDQLINFVEQLNQGIASFERFLEVMDLEPDVKDREEAVPFEPKGGEIEMIDLSFRYDKSPDWVLRHINFHVKGGETVALAGESGAGKSTLAALIPRFYEAKEGDLRIDSQDVRLVKQRSLRRSVGIVQQNVFLFDGTIRDNILYGKPNANDDELLGAVKMANLADFVSTLPEGLDTEVGERGVLLSGGQKQRISIARVFLKAPEILILDEATSSLDNESESLIQEALWKLSQNRTTIIIAHRLSTIMKADRIYVMRGGHIVEEGSHNELIAMGGYYKLLAEKGTLITST